MNFAARRAVSAATAAVLFNGMCAQKAHPSGAPFGFPSIWGAAFGKTAPFRATGQYSDQIILYRLYMSFYYQ